MDDLEIITTSDGSHTLRNKQLGETYHSVHGAVQESMHVFIKNGLEYFHAKRSSENISILEIGFGTGLNALLAWEFAAKHKVKVHYTTIEPFPLEESVWSRLNYAGDNLAAFEAMHRAAWERNVVLSPLFTLDKRRASLAEADLPVPCDVVFFDAFAPSVQPELWEHEALMKVVGSLKAGGVFVTYSAKGQVKRDLRSLGLTVETLPGPPGKLLMIRASR
jgi:tRNA U34 5-methylaminomethyl-2-thiouridine-forming methyltransferase MnmC